MYSHTEGAQGAKGPYIQIRIMILITPSLMQKPVNGII